MDRSNTTDPRSQQKLKKIAKNLPPTVTVNELNSCYNVIEDVKKSAWLCQIAWSLSEYLEVNFYSDKIIFIYHHLEDEVWRKLLKLQYLTIISKLFSSGSSEYCLLFYKQMISMMPEASIDILKRLFEDITFCNYTSGSRKVLYEQQKNILFGIWSNTPDSLKKDFINNGPVFVDKIGYMFAHLDDYSLCSVFIKDSVHREEDKNVLINYLILYDRIINRSTTKHHLQELYEDFNIQGPTFDKDSLKLLLLKCAQWISIRTISDNIFGDSIDMTTFKENISKDNKFLIDVISNFRSMEEMDIVITLHNFLVWCFYTTEAAVKFVFEHVVNTDAMIEIHYDYFPRPPNVKLFVLDYIFNDESVAQEAKNRITNPSFFTKSLEILMTKGDPTNIFAYFRNMCDAEEKEDILKTYLLSEVGVKQVLERYVHIKGEIADLVCHSAYNSKKTYKNILKFKSCWLSSDELNNQFGDYLTQNSQAIYKKYFKTPKTSDILPNESVRAHKELINARYKILMSIITGDFNPDQLDDFIYSFVIRVGHVLEVAEHLSQNLTIANLV